MLMAIKRRISVPNSSAVAQYLPFLRRYARALTGNQASGDAYVAATLEALIADRAIIDDARGPRVAGRDGLDQRLGQHSRRV
jgi:DNA-directed RNA polymerase specialized sigma24 family protein